MSGEDLLDIPRFLRSCATGATEAEEEAQMLHAIAEARANANALWQLADMNVPGDVLETAARWGLTEVLPEIWRAAFIAGWRLAHLLPGKRRD